MVFVMMGCDHSERKIDPPKAEPLVKPKKPISEVDELGNRTVIDQQNNLPKTTIAFDEAEHDFGRIKQNGKYKHKFTFTNTGENPLIISKAKGSCGCTVPTYPTEPIPPGEKGEIEVVYRPKNQLGKQMKTITITANTSPPTTQLTIHARVDKDEDAENKKG
ncbi:MAG: hypothetical protein Kow0075_03520 [Salibacteraceae bacterium]